MQRTPRPAAAIARFVSKLAASPRTFVHRAALRPDSASCECVTRGSRGRLDGFSLPCYAFMGDCPQ